jgi:hypothetical protein
VGLILANFPVALLASMKNKLKDFFYPDLLFFVQRISSHIRPPARIMPIR